MNALLPDIHDLKPISGTRDTFGETVFTRDFELLSFKEKLKVANDIVRQTMLTEVFPNPITEFATMCGDSYTASIVAIDYLREMRLGTEYLLVLARRKSYELANATTTHFILLVADDNNEWYQFDCSPFVGYKCGKVAPLSTERFYEEYYVVDSNIGNIVMGIRLALYELHSSGSTNVYTNALLSKAKDYPVLQGYADNLRMLLGIAEPPFASSEAIQTRQLLLMQTARWQKELDSLILSGTNYERQIELSQCITQEWKRYDNSLEMLFVHNNDVIPFSHLTPRYFYEQKLNTVIIKPSSFLIGVNNDVRESFLHRGNGAIAEYPANLGSVSKDGIPIMRIFHPDGYKYARSMCGPCDIFLVHRTSEELQRIKHGIRTSLGKKLHGHNVTWFDSKALKWDPIITNLVHSTDNSSETCCHYVAPFPEHQLMTRYMYPNPKLVF